MCLKKSLSGFGDNKDTKVSLITNQFRCKEEVYLNIISYLILGKINITISIELRCHISMKNSYTDKC